jgi:hypothetical protein
LIGSEDAAVEGRTLSHLNPVGRRLQEKFRVLTDAEAMRI